MCVSTLDLFSTQVAIFFSVTRWLIFFLSKWISFFLTNAIGELPLGIVRLSVGLADIEKVHELCVRAASENRCGMLAAPYVPPDIVPLADGSAHFRFGVLERKEHCLAEIEPPEAGGHSERLLPYLRKPLQDSATENYIPCPNL